MEETLSYKRENKLHKKSFRYQESSDSSSEDSDEDPIDQLEKE